MAFFVFEEINLSFVGSYFGCFNMYAVAGLGAGSGPTEHVGLYPGSTCNGLRIPAIIRGNLLGCSRLSARA